MFEEYGLVEASLDLQRLSTEMRDKLEEVVIEDAIECGAEEVKVANAVTGFINVRHEYNK